MDHDLKWLENVVLVEVEIKRGYNPINVKGERLRSTRDIKQGAL